MDKDYLVYQTKLAAKNTYISAINSISALTDLTNQANDSFNDYIGKAPATASGQKVLSNDIDSLADELFTEGQDTLKTNFKNSLKTTVDNEQRYTYKSVNEGIYNFYDNNEITLDESTVSGAKLKALLDKYDKEYADSIKEAGKNAQKLLVQLQESFNKLLPKVMNAVNILNKALDLPELESPKNEIITFNDYTIFVMNTINAQVSGVENAFYESVESVLTEEQKANIKASTEKIENAKKDAREKLEEELKNKFGIEK